MIGWRITLWAAIVLAAFAFLYLVRGILLPFILAFLISFLLDPTIRKLRLRGFSRGAAVALVFLVFFGALMGVAVWLTPIVGNQLGAFRDRLETYTTSMARASEERNFFVKWQPQELVKPPQPPNQLDEVLAQLRPTLQRLNLPNTREAIVDRYVKPYQRELASYVQNFFNSLLGVVTAAGSQLLLLVFTPLFVLFILMDMEKFKRRSASWIPPAIRADTMGLLSDVGQVFVKYMRGVTIVLIWYVAVASILLSLLGAPYSILLALLFALVYLIPLVGPVINALVLFTVTGLSGAAGNLFVNFSSSWVFAGIISAIYFGAMMVFDQLVYARVVGSSVGLHPVVSFFVIFAGGALFGPLGMLLAFPLAGAVKVILDRLLRVTSSTHGTLNLPSVPLRHRASG